jgi:hypothetical protein
VAELIRRLTLVLVLIGGLLALPAAALADGQDILDDFDDNGRIDGCYSVQEFNEALELAQADERQYGAAVDIIQEARTTNIEVEGEPCGQEIAVAADGGDDGGTSIALVIGIVAAAGAAGIGAALFVHQRSRKRAG